MLLSFLAPILLFARRSVKGDDVPGMMCKRNKNNAGSTLSRQQARITLIKQVPIVRNVIRIEFIDSLALVLGSKLVLM